MLVRRRFHLLRPNRIKQYPRELLFYDTETERTKLDDKTFLHTLKLGWANYVRLDNLSKIHTDKWFFFDGVDQFWDLVESLTRNNTKLYLIAHNQHFDFNVLQGFKQLTNRGWTLKKIILDSNRFYLKWSKGKRSIAVLDTFNFVHTSINQLGRSIGLPKLSVDFETVDLSDLKVYCKRDVEILREWFLHYLKFLQEHDLGNFGLTISMQAFNAYRHRFMHHPIYIHNNTEALQLERESYRGGRTEAFYIGRVPEDRIYYLDVNSLYPYVMRENLYPSKLIGVEKHPSVKGLVNALDEFMVIARVLVKVDKPAIGVKRERLIFPVGQFWATLTTPELKWVLDNGSIRRVEKYAIYEKAELFKDYVDYFYRLKRQYKEQHNDVYYQITKLFLNSLYGKFGQKSKGLELIADGVDWPIGAMRVYMDNRKQSYSGYVINNKLYISREIGEWYNSFPAVASHVTAYARMHLWKLMETAGLENVYYVDTDSLFVNDVGYSWLRDWLDDYELGKLKVEGVYNGLVVYGAKDYVLGGTVKLKGVPKKAKKFGEGVYVYSQFDKTKTLLRKKVVVGVLEREVVKKLRREYRKGRVLSSGKVVPLVLCDECRSKA